MTQYTVLDGDDAIVYRGADYDTAHKIQSDCICRLIENGCKQRDAEQLVTINWKA